VYIPDRLDEHLGHHHEDEGSNGEGWHVSVLGVIKLIPGVA